MMQKIQKFLEDVVNIFSIRRIIFLVSIYFLFFFFQDRINCLIENYLLSNTDFSSLILDSVLMLSCLYVCLIIYFKIVREGYSPSYAELISAISALAIFLFYFFNTNRTWEYVDMKFKYIPIPYIFVVIFPLALFVVTTLLRYFYTLFRPVNNASKNGYLDDLSISDISDDKLEYSSIINKIKHIILTHTYKKSFAIGLVGPWGNGKSSIINIVSSEVLPIQTNFLKRSYEKFFGNYYKDLIVIHFLPYLNHKEEDIISEFFTLLSKELGRFDGKLSNQVIEYSQKLTDLYNDKKIVNFFNSNPSKNTATPSKDLYDSINSSLKKINKKIVVFVDDLDRLNEVEILQVLKLIRNTADFNNTIFIVAMDKDYVINRLKCNNEILDSRYIDKFFQLEIYLPELEISKLRFFFKSELLKSPLAMNNSFEPRMTMALEDKNNLFDDYVKNFRDAKRVINQIIFEYPFFENELDLKDLLNFIYLKLKFPKIVKLLNDNRNTLLQIDKSGQFYKLKKKKKASNVNSQEGNSERIEELLAHMQVDFNSHHKYLLNDQLKDQSFSVKSFFKVDNEDIDLLIKTLAYLFGDENKIKDKTSIKFENNFRKLMQQKYLETDLLESDFQTLFKDLSDNHNPYELILPYSEIEQLYQNKKLNELVKRFEYFNSKNVEEVKRVILILGILYEKRDMYQLNEHEILKLIHIFVETRIKLNTDNKAVDAWLINNLFEAILSKENQLLLYGEVWKSKEQNSMWNISNQTLSKLSLEIFVAYLDEMKIQDILPYDFTLFKIYHSVKNIGSQIDKFKMAFVNFWSENIELLCCQVVDFGAFSNTTFRISDVTSEIFGSVTNFIDFVETSNDSNDGINEFRRLFTLFKITNFTMDIVFEFKNSQLMVDKIKHVMSYPGRSTFDEYSNIRQVFFESNDQEIINIAINNDELRSLYNYNSFSFEDKHYLVVNLDRGLGKKAIDINFTQTLLHKVIPLTSWKKKSFSLNDVIKMKVIYSSDEKYIKISSIEPPVV